MGGAERILTVASYFAAVGLVVAAISTNGFSGRNLSPLELVAVIVAGVPAVLLLVFTLFGLISYFVFMPSLGTDGHLFSAVHGTQLIHPLTTAVVLTLFCVSVFAAGTLVWIMWGGMAVIFAIHTALIVRRTRQEHTLNGLSEHRPSWLMLLLNLILGGELVTIAAGAKPLAPWRLNTLPEDTWVVDVRTKPEFHWNRIQCAESYPWGVGLAEAAQNKPKDRPVLVVCLSGHRSPAVAVMLRRLGFTTVYNLNWGILYFMLLERGKKREGLFSLTRPHRDPRRRGEDLRGVTHGYVVLALFTLIGAPLENVFLHRDPPGTQIAVGAVLGIGGLMVGLLSFKALGRNFRVYMAPRRSGTLVTRGVYAWVRHPMYTGVIVGLLGYVILFGSVVVLPAWIGVMILYAIKAVREERALADKYPEYEEYRMRTWRFLPYIY
ncbi:MAG: hypothetical protein LDL33_14690 [Desulfomonile sp.]|nr:hypothetical protein [Desulfomonile sp.]